MAELIQMMLPGLLDAEPVRVPEAEGAPPPDWRERERALDVRASWIVEAPAGSGKTGLLIQRYLKLLAGGGVERPEEVLALTFTNAAVAEIRERVLRELERAAAGGGEIRSKFERTTRSLAEAVIGLDAERGWGLRDAPGRLNIRTIDGLCAEIARALPVTGGGTAGLRPVEDAEPLYREAARRTLLALGGDDALLDEALRTVLLHRDGSVRNCEDLLAEMLGTRDQWGDLAPLRPEELSDEMLEVVVRPRLNRALELAVCRGLTRLARAFPPGVLEQMSLFAAEFADLPPAGPGEHPFAICRNLRDVPGETPEHVDHWRALLKLLVTKEGALRAAFHKGVLKVEVEKHHRAGLKDLVEGLRDGEIEEAVKGFLELPPAVYPADQWAVAKALFRVLSRALVELQLLFAERGECDFAEPALLARSALRSARGADGVEAALGLTLRHLLVDEMQDTSTGQYDLLELLTEGWEGEGKTVFLVGDPKQSIYLFRQARVERFVATMETEQMGELRLGRLHLTANFRSQAGLVEGFNGTFAEVFAAARESREDVAFVRAEAVRAPAGGVDGEGGLAWHPEVADGEIAEAKRQIVKGNAWAIREIAERWRRRPLPGGRETPWRIAVLVRSRRELREVVAAFREDKQGRPVPFRAVKIEPLKERREVLDLLALTRALKHPADRVAWWSVLRAPWCGLDLRDLHVLAGADDDQFTDRTVMELVTTRGDLLRPGSIARLERVWPVLEAAVERRSRLRTPELVERTWRSLGGDAALDEAELRNATRYLELLEEVDRELGEVELRQVRRRLERLFAAPEGGDASAVDFMTMHGAKGLEWDVVIVPELEGKPPVERSRFLEWEEIASGEGKDAAGVVLAPIAGRGEESQALNAWLRGIRSARQAAERRRLFYVACTRAREELHLFGTANRSSGGGVKAESRSLLEAAWPAAKGAFVGKGAEVVAWPGSAESEGLALAAGAEEDGAMRPAMLERMPLSFDSLARFGRERVSDTVSDRRPRFERPEGSFAARSFGNAVHAFLELAAGRLAAGAGPKELLGEVSGWKDRAVALLRGDGLRPAEVEALSRRVVEAVSRTLREPVGLWLLGARADGRSEYALTVGDEDEQPSRVRMDRVFRAGAKPGEAGVDCVWVVDYKTGSHGSEGMDEWMERERVKYAGQMEAYARALGGEEVRLGLWYPVVGRMVWWVSGVEHLREAETASRLRS